MEIQLYDPDSVIQGLLDGEDFTNRVASSCLYRCPHCWHRIRFKWRNFYKADKQSFLRGDIRKQFDAHTPITPSAELGFLDFHCPSCKAPVRIIFTANDYTMLAFHFEIEHVLVGEREL